MLTQLELNALAQLLQRTPMTQAEALWCQVLVIRLQAQIPPVPPGPEQEREPTEPEA